MTPSQIKQVLNIRMLRSDKAERVLYQARALESQALGSLAASQQQLAMFDASFDARIAAFFDKTASGVVPDSLHSSRSFHADLAGERTGILSVIEQAEQAVDLARRNVSQKRNAWAVASRAADNLKDLHAKAMVEVARAEERAEEQDADELSIARAYRESLEGASHAHDHAGG